MASPLDASNRSRHIASKACDLCRARKSQCVFDSSEVKQCRRCTRQNAECTFLRGHKTRGPRSHRRPDQNLPPLSKVEIEHLCSVDLLHRLIRGFDEFVYSLFPLIHQATCHQMLHEGMYNTDPAFLRRCICLCAITVASVPNKEAEYCTGEYPTCYKFVSRACDLVLMSRLATQPAWEDSPSLETAIDSVMLSMAAHYIGCTRRGWALANEAVLIMRDLRLQREEGLAETNAMEAEFCKRAFWILHLTQMHDCLISPTPHMLPGFPPKNTDWAAIRPRDILEDELSQDDLVSRTRLETSESTVTGFVFLAKVGECMRSILATEKYRPCLTSLSPHFSSLGLTHIRYDTENIFSRPSFSRRLAVSRDISAQFHATTESLPYQASFETFSEGIEVTVATVQISALYFTNAIIDAIFDSSDSYRGEVVDSAIEAHDYGRLPGGLGDKVELWKIRESIAQRLLDILKTTSPLRLQLNGFSLIHQIRKIAASLLDCGEDPELASVLGGRPQEYLKEFTQILASLDLNAAVSAMLHKRYADDTSRSF